MGEIDQDGNVIYSTTDKVFFAIYIIATFVIILDVFIWRN